MKMGLRLRDLGPSSDGHRFTYYDLYTFITHADASTAYHRSLHGEESLWNIGEHLLAGIYDALRIQLWMKTKDGSRGINHPKPLPRPGVKDNPAGEDENKYGSAGGMDISEMDAQLSRARQKAGT